MLSLTPKGKERKGGEEREEREKKPLSVVLWSRVKQFRQEKTNSYQLTCMWNLKIK